MQDLRNYISDLCQLMIRDGKILLISNEEEGKEQYQTFRFTNNNVNCNDVFLINQGLALSYRSTNYNLSSVKLEDINKGNPIEIIEGDKYFAFFHSIFDKLLDIFELNTQKGSNICFNRTTDNSTRNICNNFNTNSESKTEPSFSLIYLGIPLVILPSLCLLYHYCHKKYTRRNQSKGIELSEIQTPQTYIDVSNILQEPISVNIGKSDGISVNDSSSVTNLL